MKKVGQIGILALILYSHSIDGMFLSNMFNMARSKNAGWRNVPKAYVEKQNKAKSEFEKLEPAAKELAKKLGKIEPGNSNYTAAQMVFDQFVKISHSTTLNNYITILEKYKKFIADGYKILGITPEEQPSDSETSSTKEAKSKNSVPPKSKSAEKKPIDSEFIEAAVPLQNSSFIELNNKGLGATLTNLSKQGFGSYLDAKYTYHIKNFDGTEVAYTTKNVIRIDLSFDNIKFFVENRLANYKAEGTIKNIITQDEPISLNQLKYLISYFCDKPSDQKATELASLCLKHIFDVCITNNGLDAGLRVVNNPYTIASTQISGLAKTNIGYKKLLSILALYTLRIKGICVGESVQGLLKVPKIKIFVIDKSAQEFISNCQSSYSPGPEIYVHTNMLNICVNISRDADLSTWLHELTHAEHNLFFLADGISLSERKEGSSSFVYNPNPYMMNAIFYSFQNRDFPIRYAEALFPMLSFGENIISAIKNQLLKDMDKVQIFIKSKFFLGMNETLEKGGMNVIRGTSDDVQYVATIIFLYCCCFHDKNQVWVSPEEVITIYGRVPLLFSRTVQGKNGKPIMIKGKDGKNESAKAVVLVEVIDRENQSAFENKTILYHEGPIVQKYNSSLSEVFKEIGLISPTISIPQDILFKNTDSENLRTNLDNKWELPEKVRKEYGFENYEAARPAIFHYLNK